MLTHCISTYNNLPYLKLAVESVRKNSYFKDAPFIIHAENCTDGTYQWLADNGVKYNLTVYIKDLEPSGLGQGMNFIASKVTTQYINFLHSDFYVTENWDLELLKVHEREPAKKLWVNSFRIEPNMFNSPTRHGTLLVDPSDFGAYANDFNKERLEEYAKEFALLNDFEIPKGEGVSGLVKKYVWDEFGGNDPLFAPTSWDDMDLFLRMKRGGVEFVMPSKSVVWHFGARGSHRLEENEGQSSERQKRAEAENVRKFYSKWNGLPTFDAYGMINGVK
jgi:GT2 family glycosyltransferase